MNSSHVRYAILLLTSLNEFTSTQLEGIANKNDISLDFLQQIGRKLRLAKLIIVKRGPGGGYRLAYPINKISLYSVLTSLGRNMVKTETHSERVIADSLFTLQMKIANETMISDLLKE